MEWGQRLLIWLGGEVLIGSSVLFQCPDGALVLREVGFPAEGCRGGLLLLAHEEGKGGGALTLTAQFPDLKIDKGGGS